MPSLILRLCNLFQSLEIETRRLPINTSLISEWENCTSSMANSFFYTAISFLGDAAIVYFHTSLVTQNPSQPEQYHKIWSVTHTHTYYTQEIDPGSTLVSACMVVWQGQGKQWIAYGKVTKTVNFPLRVNKRYVPSHTATIHGIILTHSNRYYTILSHSLLPVKLKRERESWYYYTLGQIWHWDRT
jgi:hypothetical protein